MCKYAVVDLEMCKVPRRMKTEKFHWSQETIQIGAVILNENLEIEDSFSTYVAPEYGFIDDFINKLTGISRGDVSKAPVFKDAVRDFFEWLPEDVKLVSWSESDKDQFLHEFVGKDILIDGTDKLFDEWIDCQKTFSEKIGCERNYNLTEALVAADITFEDGAHDGLVDAINTAMLFAKMEREPELVLNPYYRHAMTGESISEFTSDIGSLLKNLDLSCLAMT